MLEIFNKRHVRRRVAVVSVAIATLIFCEAALLASPRDHARPEGSSIEFYLNACAPNGSIDEFVGKRFSPAIGADSLFDNFRAFGLEYARHVGKVSLATGLEIGKFTEKPALQSSFATTNPLSVWYIDIPITYRVNAFTPGAARWNIAIGASLPIMIDVVNAVDTLFGPAKATDESPPSDKHIDLGLGLGGDARVERQLSRDVFLTARLTFRRPLSGGSRPTHGALGIGLVFHRF